MLCQSCYKTARKQKQIAKKNNCCSKKTLWKWSVRKTNSYDDEFKWWTTSSRDRYGLKCDSFFFRHEDTELQMRYQSIHLILLYNISSRLCNISLSSLQSTHVGFIMNDPVLPNNNKIKEYSRCCFVACSKYQPCQFIHLSFSLTFLGCYAPCDTRPNPICIP